MRRAAAHNHIVAVGAVVLKQALKHPPQHHCVRHTRMSSLTCSSCIPVSLACLLLPSPQSTRYRDSGSLSTVQLTLRSRVGEPEELPRYVTAMPVGSDQSCCSP